MFVSKRGKEEILGACMSDFSDSLPFCWIVLKALAICSKFAGTNWFDCDCFHFSDRRKNCLVRLEIHLNPKDMYLIYMYCDIQAQLSQDSQRRMCSCCVHWPAHAGECVVMSYSISLWVFENRYFDCFKNVKNLSSVLVCHFFFVCFKWFVWLIISAPFF